MDASSGDSREKLTPTFFSATFTFSRRPVVASTSFLSARAASALS